MISGDIQPDLFGGPEPPAQRPDPKARLHSALIRLGDMIGDGLADEPDGAWIKAEYRRVAKALGYTMPRRNNAAAINEGVRLYLERNNCACGGVLKQTRPGSMRVVCGACCKTFQLKPAKKPKT